MSYKKFILIPLGIGLTIFLIIGAVWFLFMGASPTARYTKAIKTYESGDYAAAAEEFKKLGNYSDSAKRVEECYTKLHYANGVAAFNSGDYEKAVEEFTACGKYEDAEYKARESGQAVHYAKGSSLKSSGDINGAIEEFKLADTYKDSKDKLYELYVAQGDKAIEDKQFDQAVASYTAAGQYKEDPDLLKKCYYNIGLDAEEKKDYKSAVSYFTQVADYQDAPERLKAVYYALGTEALAKNDLENAAEYLINCSDYKDTAKIGQEAFYNRGVALLLDKDFEKAGEMFTSCGKYSYATELVKVCQAEAYLSKGDLAKAVQTYSKVSNNVKVNGFNVKARKTHASRRYTLDRQSGTYFVRKNNIYVRKLINFYGAKRWHKWYYPYTVSTQGVDIKYSVNPDGTFHIYGSVTYVRFLNYSADRNQLKGKEVTNTFDLPRATKIPSKIKLPNATLTFKGGTFTLVFKKNTKQGGSKVQFRTTVKYRKAG